MIITLFKENLIKKCHRAMYKYFLILILILKEKISNIERHANFCLKYFSMIINDFPKICTDQ